MGSLKVYATVAGFLALATSITTARAADLLPPPPPPPMPEEPAPDVGGWYLRGDVGVSSYEGGKLWNSSFDNSTFTYGEGLGSGSFVGGGVGYQFNSWFRADVTGEYRYSTGYRAVDRDASPGFLGYEKYRADYSAGLFLVNGYFDLGNWWGFTPFVGGGIGHVNHNISGMETSSLIVQPWSGVSGGTIRNKSHGDFAWALHAGVAYDITPNVKMELAYRYLNLGEARTGVVDCFCGQTKPGFKIKDIEAHELKIGVRWALGGPAPAPAYEPAPLMRKY